MHRKHRDAVIRDLIGLPLMSRDEWTYKSAHQYELCQAADLIDHHDDCISKTLFAKDFLVKNYPDIVPFFTFANSFSYTPHHAGTLRNFSTYGFDVWMQLFLDRSVFSEIALYIESQWAYVQELIDAYENSINLYFDWCALTDQLTPEIQELTSFPQFLRVYIEQL